VPSPLVRFLVQGVSFTGAAVATAPSAAAIVAPMIDLVWWGLTLALIVFCTLGAFLLMNRWRKEISSSAAGLIYCIEPVVSSILASFIAGIISVWAVINYANQSLATHLLVGAD